MSDIELSKEELQAELIKLLEAKEAAVRYRRMDTLYPDTGQFRRELYPKHVEFINASANYSQLAFIAANRIGKTLTAAFIMTMHLTGLYPDWYIGRRFLNPISAWAAGKTAAKTVEIVQTMLMGDVTDLGSGMIPKECIIGKPTGMAGIPGGISLARIKHVSGGFSTIGFKTYEQGRGAFEGTKQQVIWLDEEPKDSAVYPECLMRLFDLYSPGIIMCTFTPMFGLTKLYLSFLPNNRYPANGVPPGDPDKYVVMASWDDVPHFSEEQKRVMLNALPPHQRMARSKGIAALGSGAVYPVLEEDIVCKPFKIPEYWKKCYGLDVGWNSTAAVWLAIDPDTQCVYVYSEYKKGREHPAIHASAIKDRGDWIIGAIDPASTGASQIDGRALIDLYVNEGLLLELADNTVETGVVDVLKRFESGQLCIFSTLVETLGELSQYGRDENGKIIKENDHLMDALRYAVHSALPWASICPENEKDQDRATNDSGRSSITGY